MFLLLSVLSFSDTLDADDLVGWASHQCMVSVFEDQMRTKILFVTNYILKEKKSMAAIHFLNLQGGASPCRFKK